MDDITTFAQAVIVPIMVALITAAGGLIAVYKSNSRIKKQNDELREENTIQHAANQTSLKENETLLRHLSNQVTGIDIKVDRLDERLDHVNVWQMEHERKHLKDDIKDANM